MRIPRVFTDAPLAPGEKTELGASTSHYLTRVLRLPVNAKVVVFNGLGGEYPARITAASKRKITLLIESFNATDNSSRLTTCLGIGISRGERMDWVIQKVTELGVTEIIPLMCERTEVKLSGERLARRMNHWKKIAISACEQSGRNLLPVIQPPATISQWVAECRADRKWLLHPGANVARQAPGTANSVALMIGPEGGLSESEIEQAVQGGFLAVSLGPRVLRTETAPIVAMSIIQYLWGDLA